MLYQVKFVFQAGLAQFLQAITRHFHQAVVIQVGVDAENIADHGGLLVAHQAYLNSLKGKETPAPIDGFTNEQRFFLGYATLWGQNIRPEEIRRRTKIDPHSLGKWRVNAALRNIAPFYAAFDIKEGDPMFMAPADRVVIW